MLPVRKLLNQFILPEFILVDGKRTRPTDLTQRSVVLWLKANLRFGNEGHPALPKTHQALDDLLRLKRLKWLR